MSASEHGLIRNPTCIRTRQAWRVAKGTSILGIHVRSLASIPKKSIFISLETSVGGRGGGLEPYEAFRYRPASYESTVTNAQELRNN
jgi:hypothetical protein